jgi:hypothetical protein
MRMATLMVMGNSEGERRCDARCYNATESDCDCICGGMNHGKGFAMASNNTAEHGKALLEQLKKDHPDQAARILDVQQNLFGDKIGIKE